MPFGLKEARANLQRLMTNVLSGIQGIKCLIFLEDVVVNEENLRVRKERPENF